MAERTAEQKARYAAAVKARRAADPEKYRQRDRDRYGPKRREQHRASMERHPETVAARNARRYGEKAEAIKRLTRAWQLAHPERCRAHKAVARAVKNGELIRPDRCSQCGKLCKPDAAHLDYSKPLEVIWLCRRHHMRMDKKPKEES